MKPRLLVVLEEFHRYGGNHLWRRGDLHELVPAEILRTTRYAGAGVLVVDQVPGELPAPIFANCSTKVFFRLSAGSDVNAAALATGLGFQERAALSELRPREALASWPLDARPFVFRVPEIALPPVPTDADAFAKQAAARTAFLPCPGPLAPLVIERKRGVADGLADDERKELTALAAGPATIEEVMERAEFADRGAEARARVRLVTQLCVRFEYVGNKRKVLYLTDRGRAVCASLKIPVATFHSGPAHEWIRQYACERIAKALPGAEVLRNGAVNGVQPDARIVHEETGLVLALQVSVTNKAPNEAAAARKLVEAQNGRGFDRVVIVCATAPHRKAVEKALRAEFGALLGKPLPEKLVLLDVEAVLEPGFSWLAALRLAP